MMPFRSLTLLRLAGLMAATTLAACSTGHGGRASTAADTPPPAALYAYHWDLADARDASGQSMSQWVPPRTLGGAPLRLTLQGDRFNVSGLCNHMMGTVGFSGRQMRLSQMAGTLRHCGEPGLMQYEQAVGKHLPRVTGWELQPGAQPGDAPTLVMQFPDGERWLMRGEPTDETRYGGVGETRFMEIAPERMACSHPMMPNHRCLRVREITYDQAGRKRHMGEWQPYYGEIQRYQHQPGIRQVIRYKRYTLANPPADGSRYADVLDMIVETEATRPGQRL